MALPIEVIRSWKNITIPPTPAFRLAFDGSCPLNPGPMGVGYRFADAGDVPILEVGAGVGDGTNNLAEYEALLLALRHALRIGLWTVDAQSDSALVVRQLNGEWKIRDSRIKAKAAEVVALWSLFSRTPRLVHVYREENGEADALSRSVTYRQAAILAGTPVTGRGAGLHPWQVMALRSWWYRSNVRQPAVLARVLDVNVNTIDQIIRGETHAGVFEWGELPPHMRLNPMPAPVL